MSTKSTESYRPATDAYDCWIEKHLLSRRQAIGLGVITVSAFASTATLADRPKLGFSKSSEDEVARPYRNVHEGNGTISVRYFPFDKNPAPAHSGEMLIDGNAVAVKAGDHVHTPLGVSHGISNTASKENLKVFLTFIARET